MLLWKFYDSKYVWPIAMCIGFWEDVDNHWLQLIYTGWYFHLFGCSMVLWLEEGFHYLRPQLRVIDMYATVIFNWNLRQFFIVSFCFVIVDIGPLDFRILIFYLVTVGAVSCRCRNAIAYCVWIAPLYISWELIWYFSTLCLCCPNN